MFRMVFQVLVIDLGCTGKQNCTCSDCDCVDRPGSQCAPQSIGATEIHPPDDWGDWMLPLAYNNGAKVFLAPFGDTGALLPTAGTQSLVGHQQPLSQLRPVLTPV